MSPLFASARVSRRERYHQHQYRGQRSQSAGAPGYRHRTPSYHHQQYYYGKIADMWCMFDKSSLLLQILILNINQTSTTMIETLTHNMSIQISKIIGIKEVRIKIYYILCWKPVFICRCIFSSWKTKEKKSANIHFWHNWWSIWCNVRRLIFFLMYLSFIFRQSSNLTSSELVTEVDI